MQQPEPEIGGNLIVTAATGVQFTGCAPNNFTQASFNGCVNIFIAGFKNEIS